MMMYTYVYVLYKRYVVIDLSRSGNSIMYILTGNMLYLYNNYMLTFRFCL